MFGLGYGEIFIVFLIIVILFGGSKLPQLGRSLGEAIRGFKGAIGESDNSRIEENKPKSSKNQKGE